MTKPRIGKIRGLQQLATSEGVFAMCAMDHRGSFQQMINRKNPDAVGYLEMVERKQELCEALAPHSSAVLLDPIFGAAQCIAGGALPKDIGLLVSLEATGYGGGAEGRITELLPEWNAAKVKRMGGSAGKLLLYYRPDLKDLAARQREVVRKAAEDCAKSDLAFLVEPKTYPVGVETKQPEVLAARMPEQVIETAREITGLDIDVLKAEFPASMKHVKDEGKLLDLCRQLDQASRTPWVILSSGVDYDVFAKQVEIACRAGASGFLGGRSIWQEAVAIPDKKERVKFLSTTAADRMKRLSEIAGKFARPWHRKAEVSRSNVSLITEDWYRSY